VSSVEIVREGRDPKGRYPALVGGVGDVAELRFSKASEEFVIADHTMVAETMRGLGVGALLASRVVEGARRGGHRILVLCPFVSSQVQRHPEWSDVLWTGAGARPT
jgi:predicted GNAT family acetyltransferase